MLKPNDRIGQYQLLAKLGNGAFGEVWRAVKADALVSAEYAIKFALSDDVDRDAIKREAEVWKLASGHPNIIPIIEASLYDEQVLIVSEFAREGSLQGWLNKHNGRAPSIEAAVTMTDGILAGLEHLHAQRIIHRDLKPDNVLLQGGTPRLADFGLSRVLKSSNSTNHIAGTIPYMSPETFKGDRSAQADLWATAVILYQLLSGRLPFVKGGQSPSEMMFAILTAPPHPLPANIPAGLQKLLAQAFEKEPAQRFASAQAMRATLRQALQPEPPTIKEPKPQPKPRPVPEPTEPIEPETIPVKPRPRPQPEPVKPQPVVQRVEPKPTPPKSNRKWLAAIGALVLSVSGLGYWASRSGSSGEVEPGVTPVTRNATLPNLGDEFTETTNNLNLVMKRVPGGSFMMGSPANEAGRYDNEGLQHRVTVKDFYIGKTEITQAQWQAVMGNNPPPSHFKGDLKRPVENVSWNDAQEFCKKLNALTGKTYSLPSEAEWEYAARAKTTTPYAGELDAMAWYANNSGLTTHPVGQKQPNVFGLYDMHGNVWEWCEDVWHDGYGGAPTDGAAWLSGGDVKYRVLRGGSWVNDGALARSAFRGRLAPGDRYVVYGFRLVLSARTP
jgi:formylglycine-generating enzyme required for sulfatase activity